MTQIIPEFTGSYSFLSNFYRDPITIDLVSYPTVEHYYQSQKAAFPAERETIAKAPTPAAAKEAGRRCSMRVGFDDEREHVMETALRAKFAQGSAMASRLMATGEAILIEGNYWHDNFWGDCSCQRRSVCKSPGQNRLGRLLMRLRAELVEGFSGYEDSDDDTDISDIDPEEEDIAPDYIIALTGHRDADEAKLRPVLTDRLNATRAVHRHLLVRCGMAIGADIIIGEVCVELKIPFDAYIPDPGYFGRYVTPPWRSRYIDLQTKARRVIVCRDFHHWQNNFVRNDYMIKGHDDSPPADEVWAAYRYDDIDQFRPPGYRPRKGGTAAGILSALKAGRKLGQDLIHIPDC